MSKKKADRTFTGVLVLQGVLKRHRNSSAVLWKDFAKSNGDDDKEGVSYLMRLDDFVELVRESVIERGGFVDGMWDVITLWDRQYIRRTRGS